MTVELTPDIIRSTRFRDKMRGYNPIEVDAFREQAAMAVDVLQTRLAEETERALKAEGALETNSATDDSVRQTLVLAQRTAAMAVTEANDHAARIRSEAQAESATIRTDADVEAHRLVTEAAQGAAAERADAARERADAEQECAARRQTSDAEITGAQASSREAIAAAKEHADAALAAEADGARRELDQTINTLTAQRADLRTEVEELATYLATERARVLAVLTAAREDFGESLSPSPRPASIVSDPADASPDHLGVVGGDGGGMDQWAPAPGLVTTPVTGGSANEWAQPRPVQASLAPLPHSPRTVSSRTSDGPAATTPELRFPGDKRPSSLLFTLEHEVRPAASLPVSRRAGSRVSMGRGNH